MLSECLATREHHALTHVGAVRLRIRDASLYDPQFTHTICARHPLLPLLADVLRTYGNLSSLVRTMLGWRDRWSASQLPLPGVCDTGVTINTPHDGNTAGAGVDTYDGSHHRVAAGEGGDALWLEPQAGVYLVVNENAPNMVPCVPIILGAGGCAVDFLGQPLIGRKLVAGRLSVAYAANEQLLERVLGLVSSARAASGTDGR